MTYEQNVKAILESNFAGFKEEIIDIACQCICELSDNPYDRLKTCKDMTVWEKGRLAGYKEAVKDIMR